MTHEHGSLTDEGGWGPPAEPPTEAETNLIDAVLGTDTVAGDDMDAYDIESRLRDVIAWGRAQAAEKRESDPVRGRACALVATHAEEALYRLLWPVP